MDEIFEHLNVIEGNDTGGDQEKTIECKTLEEYEMKKKAYLDAVFLQTIDVNYIMKNIALPAYRNQIKPERLKVLDKRIDAGTYKVFAEEVLYDRYSYIQVKKQIKSMLKNSKNVIQIPNTGIYLVNDLNIEGAFGLLLSENVGVHFLDNVSITRDKLTMKERNYISMQLITANINKPVIIYDEPVRPLPPEGLDSKQLEIDLEIEKNKILLNDNSSLVFEKAGVIPQKEIIFSKPATLSRSFDEKEFLIGGETVDKKVYDLYIQYKKDRMIPSDQTGGTAPKPGTPEKYQNLSWEYFKTSILNKDYRYMVR